MSELHVLIAGTGLGGLTLARSLRGHGIDVTLVERDASPWERPQGYRLHLDADARNAAREVLPPDLFGVFVDTSHVTEPFTTVLGTDLSVIARVPTDDELDERVWPGPARTAGHANVDRATLRRILLADLDDHIRFGAALESYVDTGDGVTAHLADGTSVRGDVLVGADGVGSAVRRGRAPGHDPVDAGITAIYGRIPLSRAAALVPPEVSGDIFAIASDERKVFLGLGAVRFPTDPARAGATLGLALPEQEDYVVCVVGGRHAFLPSLAATGVDRDGARLQQIAAETLGGWPAAARAVVEAGDPASFFPVRMRTSVPHALDAPSRVTLLGDAVHAMTPTLGRGANLAMRDGALLGRALAAVAPGRVGVRAALAAYERDLLDHGFAVVTEAARIGGLRMAQDPLPSGVALAGPDRAG